MAAQSVAPFFAERKLANSNKDSSHPRRSLIPITRRWNRELVKTRTSRFSWPTTSRAFLNCNDCSEIRLVQTCLTESGPKNHNGRQDSDLGDFCTWFGTRRSKVQILFAPTTSRRIINLRRMTKAMTSWCDTGRSMVRIIQTREP